MAYEPPRQETGNGKSSSLSYQAINEHYADYTFFMRGIAQEYEEARQNFSMRSLVFFLDERGNSKAMPSDEVVFHTSNINGFLRTLYPGHHVALTLSLIRPLDEQFEAHGIDPTQQYDWPEKPVNCTLPASTYPVVKLSPPAEPVRPEALRLPRLKRNDAHDELAVRFLEVCHGIVDGDLKNGEPNFPRSYHTRLEDVSDPDFSEVPASLAIVKGRFDRAFIDGYSFLLAYVNNQGTISTTRHKTSVDALIDWQHRTSNTSDKLFLGLSTARGFMEQIRGASPSYVSPTLASQYPIIAPGVFPQAAQQRQISRPFQ